MYRRYNTQNELKPYQKKYKEYLKRSRGGFLSKNQKLRLLGLKKGDEGTPEADFWYRLKRSAKGSLVDLQMIFDLADDDQKREIFQMIPLVKKQKNQGLSDNEYITFANLISNVLVTDWRQKESYDVWKAFVVKDLMNSCLNYITTSGILMTKSHMRLIDEMRDLIDAIVGVASQVPVKNRKAVKF